MTHANKAILGLCLALAWTSPVLARGEGGGPDCGNVERTADAGPYDYRTAPLEKRHLAQPFRDQQGKVRIADLDNLLLLFPNHPQALMAMAELARQEKTDHPRGSRYSMGCWYERAVSFTPSDIQVRLAYGYWLAKKGERAAAIRQLDQVRAEAMESEMLSYNLGLAYCEAGDYDKALKAAQAAYGLGHVLPGLRNRLISVGKWREPGAGKNPVMPVSSKTGE